MKTPQKTGKKRPNSRLSNHTNCTNRIGATTIQNV